MPDSLSSSIRGEYDGAATEYDRRWARYNRASLALLRPWIAGRKLGRVLDVGCGTGNLAGALAEWGAAVDAYVGVDLSPAMLDIAAPKLGAGGWPGAAAAGSALALPVATASFDTAVCASNLHYWPGTGAGLSEIRRVLRPGGRLLLVDWDRAPLRMRVLNLWMRRALRVEYQRMYSRQEIRALLHDTGFRVDHEARGAAGVIWRLAAFEAASIH
ncbi:MAG TPA: class I SAM-dependent methyltransferase [Longimicrobium sp.]|jgi:ubiquinone/menaquinone biosynthesis C-methylase UbiE|uniref:class I SAM-dependent methyltransferase n=1 Tax=Longimicrobium sp. TaxID=2029185 RepID=UPI002ED8D094